MKKKNVFKSACMQADIDIYIKQQKRKKKWSGSMSIIEQKLFFGIQVSSTNHYMISAIIDTSNWALYKGDIC